MPSMKQPWVKAVAIGIIVLGAGAWIFIFISPLSPIYASYVAPRLHDMRVKSDLAAVATALEAYYAKNHTYVIPGTGFAGSGVGWLAVGNGRGSDAFYASSILSTLKTKGYLTAAVADDTTFKPAGARTPRSYMLYICRNGQGYALSATINFPSSSDLKKQYASCRSSITKKFGKNYIVGNHQVTLAQAAVAKKTFSPSCKLSAKPATIKTGAKSTLTWAIKNGIYSESALLASPQGIIAQGKSASGSLTVQPQKTTLYSFVATNSRGSITCTTTVMLQNTK